MRFLLFTLYAPMGSFGEIAVGERRMGWARPGRSAVLGLVAAAQGIVRADEPAHQTLEQGLFYAVRIDAPGKPLWDYHTAQAPKARRGKSYATRREELAASDLNTVLSTREWRTDALFTAALWLRPNANLDLGNIAAALEEPSFTLYLGRKSAPLGLPLRPELIEAADFKAALDARDYAADEQDVLARIAGRKGQSGTNNTTRPIAFDGDAPHSLAPLQQERRRDSIASRARWQFQDRVECLWRGPRQP